MKTRLDMGKIANRLGGERRGKVRTTAGYFGAMQVLADVETRLRIPTGGGRPTDPQWTERRLLPLAPQTLQRLAALAERIRTDRGINIEPMQLAAMLLEKTAETISVGEAKELVDKPKAMEARRKKRGG